MMSIATNKLCALIAVVILYAVTTAVFAADKGHIKISMQAQIEQVSVDVMGRKLVKMVDAELVLPGEEVVYTITFENISDETTTGVVISNPIPEHMVFVSGLSKPQGVEVVYSVDGKHFDRPEKLRVAIDGDKTRPAVAADYTHIRWLMGDHAILPAEKNHVSYKARLK